VHGGGRFVEPVLVTPAVRSDLDALAPLAPEHLPVELEAVDAFARTFPDAPQVACFDTAFHRRMPAVAQTFALPPSDGVVRYGFHGLSYEYVVEELNRLGEPAAARGRLVVAHLGSGASMAAVRDGVGVDTTMGFTPAGGLVMGTRCGDIDPGVLVHLLRTRGLDAAGLEALVNRQSGLLGVSGTTADMRELLAGEAANPRAALAVELFCYQARKHLGAMAAALGGADALVFTGGMGANSPAVRERICRGTGYLGIELDPARNAADAAVISAAGSRVPVRVVRTDEERMIARHTRRVLGG
jgi:acetate kinase